MQPWVVAEIVSEHENGILSTTPATEYGVRAMGHLQQKWRGLSTAS